MILNKITWSILLAGCACLAAACLPSAGARDAASEGKGVSPDLAGGIRRETPDADACGPEFDGLALGLAIVDAGTGSDVERVVRLTISNVGSQPVTLVGTVLRHDQTQKPTYSESVIRTVTFTTFPEMPLDHAQSLSDPSPPTEVSQTIAPGEQLVVTGHSKGDKLLLDSGTGVYSRGLRFTSPGKFFVRANLYVSRADGVDASLWSNEQPYTIGHSQAQPKPPTATVTSVSSDSRTVELGVGSHQGVEIGDAYYDFVRRPLGGVAFRVVDVRDRYSTATLDPSAQSYSPSTKELPKRGDTLERGRLP